MKVIEPGHVYELFWLDRKLFSSQHDAPKLNFVKREQAVSPGFHSGTNMQDVMRALIDRLYYVDAQDHSVYNQVAISNLRRSIEALETRAALRHGRKVPNFGDHVEDLSFCTKCGHIGCQGECHQ